MQMMPTLFHRDSPQPSTAKGERIYAIGEIHGQYDLFRRITEKIVGHREAVPTSFGTIKIVLLGDIIDRGPESAQCLEFAYELVKDCGFTLLRGNHEDLLLNSMDGNRAAQEIWLANGGISFLEDYGIRPPQPGEDSFDFAERITGAVPAHLTDMLRKSPLGVQSGDYFFVHAGVRPGVPLNRQRDEDLLFIREQFTQSRQWHGAMIVHGHTIVEEVEISANRIAVDTGAYRTGRLSCLCVEGRRRQVLHT